MKLTSAVVAFVLLFGAGAADAAGKSFDRAICTTLGVAPKASQPVSPQPFGAKQCSLKSVTTDGVTYPMPDPACTPGSQNPTTTVAVLKHAGYSTKCVRDQASSAQDKNGRYGDYMVQKVGSGEGDGQLCELDHLVPLEIGGADTLDNIWPQCGRSGQGGEDRYFKLKDMVENFLAAGVKSGGIGQSDAQRGIAENWTQYLAAARRHCTSTTACVWGP